MTHACMGCYFTAGVILFASFSLHASIAAFLSEARRVVNRMHHSIVYCRSVFFSGDSCLIGVEPYLMSGYGLCDEKGMVESIKVMRDDVFDEPGWIGLAVIYEVSDGQGCMLPLRRYALIPEKSVLSLPQPTLKSWLFPVRFFIDTLTPAVAVWEIDENKAPLQYTAARMNDSDYSITNTNESRDSPNTTSDNPEPSFVIDMAAHAATPLVFLGDRIVSTTKNTASQRSEKSTRVVSTVSESESDKQPLGRLSYNVPFNPPLAGSEPDFSSHARLVRNGPSAAGTYLSGVPMHDLILESER